MKQNKKHLNKEYNKARRRVVDAYNNGEEEQIRSRTQEGSEHNETKSNSQLSRSIKKDSRTNLENKDDSDNPQINKSTKCTDEKLKYHSSIYNIPSCLTNQTQEMISDDDCIDFDHSFSEHNPKNQKGKEVLRNDIMIAEEQTENNKGRTSQRKILPGVSKKATRFEESIGDDVQCQPRIHTKGKSDSSGKNVVVLAWVTLVIVFVFIVCHSIKWIANFYEMMMVSLHFISYVNFCRFYQARVRRFYSLSQYMFST